MSTELSVYGQAVIDGGEPVGCELHVRREVEQVSLLGSRPDPYWSMVDAAGHFHAAWQDGTRVEYPTLRTKSRPCDGACGDPTHTESYHVCSICGEEIEPGTIPGPHHAGVSGPEEWECLVAADLRMRELVSIRVVREDTEWFGVAQVVNVSAAVGDGASRSRLFGASPLGRRKVTQ